MMVSFGNSVVEHSLSRAIALVLRTSFYLVVNMSLLGSCSRGDENALHSSAF
jgi:hypothetical protein